MKSIFTIIGIVLSSMLYSQTTYTFHTAGNWTDAANWSPSYPGNIVSNASININANCNYSLGLGMGLTNVELNINSAVFIHPTYGNHIIASNSIINVNIGSTFTSGAYLQCYNTTLNNYGIYNNNDFNEMFDLDINNYGSINISGPMIVGLDVGTTSQVFNNFGSISINNGSAMGFNNDLTFNNIGNLNIGNGGSVYLGYTTSNTGTIFGSGNFEVCATCTYSSSPTSTIQPGNSPGGISFNNINGTISPARNYNFEINGTTQITQYDWIGIENINLTNSILNVTWGFTPSIGQEFDIITHGSRTGQFATVNIPPIAGLNFTLNYSNPTKTSIVVSSALPVTWLSSPTATIKNNQSHISWSVASQVNNSHFIIEHGSNGRLYYEIGKVQGQDHTSDTKHYNYIHETPFIGINYYRIKQVDYDGQYSFSNIASVVYEDDGRDLAIYPNPATDEVTVDVIEDTEVSVVNMMGRVVKKQTVNKENNRVDISELSSGLYIFTIGSNNIQRLVKH